MVIKEEIGKVCLERSTNMKKIEIKINLPKVAKVNFSNFEKLLPIGPIAAKKLGGFASTSKDQPKT